MNTSRVALRSLLIGMLLMLGTGAFAQSASELAGQLQTQLEKGAAVRMKFTVAGEGVFTILVDMHARRIRIEAPALTIVTDGSTVWNYNYKRKQLTIDALSNSPNSAMKRPDEFAHFADSYSAEILSHKGKTFVVKFTPNAMVKQMLASLGTVESITLTLLKGKHGLTIKHAELATTNTSTTVSALAVTSVSHVSNQNFIFAPPKEAKIIDLRE